MRQPSDPPITDPESTARLMLGLLAGAKRVLDFGCAGPTVSAAMVAAGFDVTTVPIDKLAQLVADGTSTDRPMFAPSAFDAAMLGDVLERVRDPERLLEETHAYLAPDGVAILVLSNLTHATMRLALLAGTFDFRPRLFTLESARELCARAGYEVTRVERSKGAPSLAWDAHGTSDLAMAQDRDAANRDPEDDTVQFILQAKPMSQEDRLARGTVAAREDGMESDEVRVAYENLARERDLLAAQLLDRTRVCNAAVSDGDALRRQLTALHEELAMRSNEADVLRGAAALGQERALENDALQKQIATLSTKLEDRAKHDRSQSEALAQAALRERALIDARRAVERDVRAQLAEVERLLEHVQTQLDAVHQSKSWQIATGLRSIKTRLGGIR